jgi:hypothetical protein
MLTMPSHLVICTLESCASGRRAEPGRLSDWQRARSALAYMYADRRTASSRRTQNSVPRGLARGGAACTLPAPTRDPVALQCSLLSPRSGSSDQAECSVSCVHCRDHRIHLTGDTKPGVCTTSPLTLGPLLVVLFHLLKFLSPLLLGCHWILASFCPSPPQNRGIEMAKYHRGQDFHNVTQHLACLNYHVV